MLVAYPELFTMLQWVQHQLKMNDNDDKVILHLWFHGETDGDKCVLPLKDVSEGYKGKSQRQSVDEIPG